MRVTHAEPLRRMDPRVPARCGGVRDSQESRRIRRILSGELERHEQVDRRMSAADAGVEKLGAGSPLPAGIREWAGDAIRVHTDEHAWAAAESVGARAFAWSGHVVFNRGEYQPESDSGRALIAHEALHCIQARAAGDLSIHRQPQPGQEGGPQAVINYDLICDEAGRVPDSRLAAAFAAIKDPVKLEQVYTDMESGNGRARVFFESWRLSFFEAGKAMGDQAMFCALTTFSCPTWELLKEFRPDTRSGAALRNAVINGYIMQAEANGFGVDVISNLLMLIPALSGVERAMAREAAAETRGVVKELRKVPAGGSVVPLFPRRTPLPAGASARATSAVTGEGPYLGQTARKLAPAAEPVPAAEPKPQGAPAPVIPFPAVKPLPAAAAGARASIESNYGAMIAQIAAGLSQGLSEEEMRKEKGAGECSYIEAWPRGGNDEHTGLAAWVTGQPVEYTVTTPEGESYQFDGMDATGTLYEVKTRHDFLRTLDLPELPEWSHGQTRAITGAVPKLRQSIALAQMVASRCGHDFRVVSNNLKVRDMLRDILGDIVPRDHIEWEPFRL